MRGTERLSSLVAGSAAVLLASAANPAAAAEPYPSRPIEAMVPFGPGGGADVTGRQFARQAETKLGVAVPVVNAAGASGDVGLARAVALTATAWAAGVGTPRLDRLEYVALMQNSPSMLLVARDSPLLAFADSVADSNVRPGSIDIATSGVGTPDNITPRHLAANGVDTVAIPSGKPGERYASIVGGHTDVLCEEHGDVVGFLQSGDLRPPVVFDAQRHAAFPDVPTSGEARLEIGNLPNLRAVAVPARTPPERVERLRAVAAEDLAGPDRQAFCANTSSCTGPLPPAEVKRLVATTYERAEGYLDRFETAAT